MFGRFVRQCLDLLHRPSRILWICLSLAIAGVVFDGTAFRLWSLKREHHLLEQRIVAGHQRAKQLHFRLQSAQRPDYIEKAARDQLDLVKEGDLVFIFADETAEGPSEAENRRHGS